jgi:hypothetical protein
MIKIVEICCCEVCPFCDQEGKFADYCLKENRTMTGEDSKEDFPKWCPLETKTLDKN